MCSTAAAYKSPLPDACHVVPLPAATQQMCHSDRCRLGQGKVIGPGLPEIHREERREMTGMFRRVEIAIESVELNAREVGWEPRRLLALRETIQRRREEMLAMAGLTT